MYRLFRDTLFIIIFSADFSEEKLKELVAWLKSKPHYNAERQTSGNLIMDPEIVKILEDTVDAHNNEESQIKRTVVMKVKPQLLYKVNFCLQKKFRSHNVLF